MTERTKIVQRAKELILQHPTMGKDAVNKQLRREFGTGIRRIEVAKLIRELAPKSPETYQKSIRDYREKQLTKEGFLPEESKFYSQFPIASPGVEKVRRFRKSEINKAKRAGIPRQRIERYIKDSYVAHGWVDKDNTIRPDFWNKHAFEEILKKPKERVSVLIQPENYQYFRRTVQAKFKPEEVLKMTSLIPTNEWSKRMADYQTLRKSYFTHFEAMTIITGTAEDKDRKMVLQTLDLNDPVWQEAMDSRVKWANDEFLKLRKQGKTPYQAKQAIMKELQRHDGDKKDKSKPYDFLRDYYKYTKQKTSVDFIEAKQKRDLRLRKKRLPYRVR